MPRGFFITGTDTGVGKTVVTAALIRALKGRGLSVCGMKPVESGCERDGSGNLVPADGTFLMKASGVKEPLDDITPYCFEHPLAPMVAAELEMRAIDMLWVERAYERLSERYDIMVVEGVGGLMVPLQREYSVLDMAKALGLPVIVVASAFLGTINHTILTVDRALSEGLDVAGVILNFPKPPIESLAEETNPRVLLDMLPVPLLGVMPWLSDLRADTIEEMANEHVNMDTLAGHLADTAPHIEPEI
jgi:dethiobiotin synthetase